MRSSFLARVFFALGLGIAAAGTAQAAQVGVSVGRSMTSGSRWTDVVFIDGTGATRHWGRVAWQPALSLGWIDARDTHADRLDHHVYVGGAGVRLVDWWHRAFFSFQLGVAGGRTDALSSAGQFISTLGWQGDHYQLMLRHISNGHIYGGRNLGETMFLVGFSF